MTGLAFRWDGEGGKRGKDGKGKEGQVRETNTYPIMSIIVTLHTLSH